MPINVDAHMAKYNGQHIDIFGGQCVANVAVYCRDNGMPIAYADAHNWWQHPSLTGAFDFIANNPADPNQLPKRGDIMIWNGNVPNSGGAGHIGIYLGGSSPTWTGFDQNWGGNYCHQVTHNWSWIIGWATPKTAAPAPQPQGEEMIATQDQARDAYALLRGSRNALSQDELDATAGHRTWANFAVDARGEIAAREAAKQATLDQLASLSSTINQLNQAITDITNQSNATKADKDAALSKIADLTTQLETAHDQIVELQNKPVPPQATPPTEQSTAISTVIKFIRTLLGIKD